MRGLRQGTQNQASQNSKAVEPQSPTAIGEVVDNRLLLRERQSLSFEDMTVGRFLMSQWVAIHHGQMGSTNWT